MAGQKYGVSVVWDGLTTVDQLAAKYPDVIDYYLHDGKSAITEAYRDAMALMSLSNVDGDTDLEVGQVAERIQHALNTLDRDPHYLYELHFGQGEPPAPTPRTGLVISAYTTDTSNSRWWQVDVLARCAASVEERPITITGTLAIEPNSDFASDVRDFFEFGTPFTSPEGSYTGHLDAPGGLGGKLAEATIRTGAAADAELGENPDLVLAIIDPDGNVLAEVDVARTDRSHGSKGVRALLTETNGVFEFTHRFNLVDQTTTQTLTLLDVIGKPVSDVLAGVTFLAGYKQPNRIRARVRQLPASRAKIYDVPAVSDDAITGNLEQLSRVLEVLADLQSHTDTVLTLPDLNRHAAQIRSWLLTADILAGEEVTMTVKDDNSFHVEVAADTELPTGTFSVELPLDVAIGEQAINFGRVRATLTDPQLHSTYPCGDGRVTWVFTTPDRTITYALPGEADDDAGSDVAIPLASDHATSGSEQPND